MTQAESPRHQRGDISPDGRHYWDGDVWQWKAFWLVADDVVKEVDQCFGRSATAVHFLAAGMLNQSWRVSTRDGSYVLRVSRRERSRAQVAYEHECLRQLTRHVSEVVAPLTGNDGETIQPCREYILSLFPFIEGMNEEAVDPDVRWSQSADVMARLHRASLEHLHLGHRFGFQPFDDEWRSTWNDVIPTLRRGLAGEDGFGEMMGMLDRDVAMLEVWLDDLQTSRRPLAEATIHGDLNLRNLIFRDNRLVAVIDWDDCRVGPIAWEVAQTAFEVAAAERLTFWSAYLNAGGPLLPGDVNLLPNLARMGALLQLQYTVKDGHATPHAMDQLTNVTRALARISGINS